MKIVGNPLKNMKTGFTLIELLAVIVILAIIALIATPVVLNIINESKESSLLRSAEFYLDAVEYTIADAYLYHGGLENKEYPITPNGDICKVVLVNNECSEENTLKVEVNGDKPTGGSITINNGNISDVKIILDEKTIVKDTDGTLIYQTGEKVKTIDDICTHDTSNGIAAKTVGAKYTCEVKEGTSYTFYVLNATSTEVNLIMNANINASGEAVIPGETSDTGLVAWNSNGLNTGGPITAMQFLYNATKDWTNIDPISYEYKDEEYQGTTEDGISYTSFVADKGILTITSLSGDTTTIGNEAEPLRVRMPIYAYKNGQKYGEVADKTENNIYLYDNLDENGVTAPYGYWTLSSYAADSILAWIVHSDGGVYNNCDVDNDFGYGARPVITLKI